MVTIRKENDRYVIEWEELDKPIVADDIEIALAIVARILDSEFYRQNLIRAV